MLGHDFYFGTIRKYISMFGALFDDIHISRTDSTDNTTHYIKVPLNYSPKEKVLARVDADPEIGRQTALLVPRMSFEIMSMAYNGARKLPSTVKVLKKESTDKSAIKQQYTPVPYDFIIELNIFVKNAEDGNKILEQIIPFFTPDFTPTVNLIPEMDEIRDIPIELTNVETIDTYNDTFEKRRAIIHTLTFKLKGYLYQPIKTTKVIKFANTNFFIANTADIRDSIGNVTAIERVTVRPGLDANGNPTSNISITVPLSDIESDDNYGYIVIIENL